MAENRRPKGPHGPGGMMPGEKAKDFKKSFKKLVEYIGNYKYAVIVVIVFAVAGTVFNVIGPKILGNATTEIFTGLQSKFSGGSGIDFKRVGQILVFVAVLYGVSALLSLIHI